MATSRGIFELKYFFTSAIAAADGGEAHSAEAVRHRIKQLIDAEAPRTCCPTTPSSRSCARPGSTSRAAPSPNTARRCASRRRCSAGARSAGAADPQADGTPRRTASLGRRLRCSDPRASDRPAGGAQRPNGSGGRRCLFASRARTSTSARPCARASRRGSPRPPASISTAAIPGHVTVGKEGFGFRTECAIHLDSGITLRGEARGRRLCERRPGGRAHREAAAALQAPAQGPPGRADERAERSADRQRLSLRHRGAGARGRGGGDRVQPGHHRRIDDRAEAAVGQRSRHRARHDRAPRSWSSATPAHGRVNCLSPPDGQSGTIGRHR